MTYETYREAYYPHLSQVDFVRLTCNAGMTLPEHEVDGNTWHLPCVWLGQRFVEYDTVQSLQQRLGWKDLPYLLILPRVYEDDISYRTIANPETRFGKFLRSELTRAGIDPALVIATALVRFAIPEHIKAPLAQHKSAGRELMLADINGIRPKVILACGSDVLKQLFGSQMKMDSVRGNVLSYDLPDGTSIPVVPTTNPYAFMASYADLSVFRLELKRAVQVNNNTYKKDIGPTDYRLIQTLDQVRALVAEIAEARPRHIAYDTEFGNSCAREEFTETTSIQLCWAQGKAAYIQLLDITAQEVTKTKQLKKSVKSWTETEYVYSRHYSKQDEAEVWRLVADLLNNRKWSVTAHHTRVDVEQAYRNGVNIDDRVTDSFDTMLVHHLLYGDESQGLDHLVRKYTPEFGAYWSELEEWLDTNGRGNLRFGYRNIPLSIMFPYGCKDVDSTWRIRELLEPELEANDRLKSLYWNHVALTSRHLLELERHGLLIDEDRRMRLHDLYKPIYEKLVAQARSLLNWPSFNPKSKDHMAYALFSTTSYKGKDKFLNHKNTAKRPTEGCTPLNLVPVCNTDKYPVIWSEIEASGKQLKHSPSTKAVILEIMAQQYPDEQLVQLLRELSVLGKYLTTYLAPVELNEFGVPAGGKGFHQNIWSDGRVRTKIGMLTETGRFTSKQANLQTWPKKQEALLRGVLIKALYGISAKEYDTRTFDGKKKKGSDEWDKPPYSKPDFIKPEDRLETKYGYASFKSCVMANPGYVLVEADFKNAEVFLAAFFSGDPVMIELVTTGRDIHSETAAKAFNLPEAADLPAAIAALRAGDPSLYKKWNDNFKKVQEALRVAGKSVVFGIFYGRKGPALVRELERTGVKTTLEQINMLIASFSDTFAVAWKWLEDGAQFAVENEYIETVFGRKRYFSGVSTKPEFEQAAVRREAKNSRLQSGCADLLAQFGNNLFKVKFQTDIGASVDFKYLLPIHDAGLFEVKKEDLNTFLTILKYCMSTGNKIPGTEYFLDIDVEIMTRWGEKH